MTLKVSFKDTTVVFGDTVTLLWKAEHSTSILFQSKKSLLTHDSITLIKLLRDTTFTIIANGSGGSLTQTASIKVGDWTTSRFGLLTYGSDTKTHPWYTTNISHFDNNNNYLDSLYLSIGGGAWSNGVFMPSWDIVTNYYFWNMNGDLEGFAIDGTPILWNCPWSIEGQIYKMDRTICKIIDLTKTKFFYDMPSFIDTDGTSKHGRITCTRKD